VIYADPPYPVKKILRKVRPNQVEMDYPTMTLDAIKMLPVRDFATDDACLFLWTTHKFLPDAFWIMLHWGFKYQ
ncbi:unnamed protein product, partial [marine sediment metagenome]